MSGLLRAALARFELALGMTAGIDSRLVLAAARPVRDRLRYVTLRQAKMPDDSADIVVPSRLLAKLGLKHEIVRAAVCTSPEFGWVFKRSVWLAHDHYSADAEAVRTWGGHGRVAVTGSGAEIGRCAFPRHRWRARRFGMSAEQLARLEYMDHPYATRCFEEWLDGLNGHRHVPLLDLFEWEQGHGNWLAMTQLEFDTAWHDIVTPYNCRALLTTLLSVDERLRRAPQYLLAHAAIRRAWPELLCEPINPKPHWLRRYRTKVRAAWRGHGPAARALARALL
jgi:hypothetical protein